VEATRQIRRLAGPRGRVPIVAVTANALDQHAEECRRAGMSDHLAKPFTRQELARVLGRAAAQTRRAPSDSRQKLDRECLAQVSCAMGEEAAERLLDCLALRIESLLRKLDEQAGSPDELATLAHELKGSGGSLGFTALSSAACRFERAVLAGGSDAREIRCEATAALEELRRRRSLETLASV
jgi:HPt (histidine-containing phosphotransfer) domain-containing protein